jgi:hypothetical protein
MLIADITCPLVGIKPADFFLLLLFCSIMLKENERRNIAGWLVSKRSRHDYSIERKKMIKLNTRETTLG